MRGCVDVWVHMWVDGWMAGYICGWWGCISVAGVTQRNAEDHSKLAFIPSRGVFCLGDIKYVPVPMVPVQNGTKRSVL